MEQLGIKETKELLVFLARFGNAINRALEDGKITWLDAGVLLEPLMASKAAFEGTSIIPQELADLDSMEAIDLSATVAAELDLDDERAEVLTEKGLALGLALVAYVNEIRNKPGEPEEANEEEMEL